ncbi:MAG: metallophosphoesterase [Phycisphaerae bacterium]
MKKKLFTSALALLLSVNAWTFASSPGQSFKIAVLPDTQHYSRNYPETFAAQTQWVADNKEAENIAFLTQLGDIVNNGGSDPNQWVNADAAIDILDGVLPYSVTLGNHDLHTPHERYDGAAEYLYFFGPQRYENYNWYGGSDRKGWCHYQIFTAGEKEWLHLNLPVFPDDEELKWAQDVLDEYPTMPAIYSTHAYLSDMEDPNEPFLPLYSGLSYNQVGCNSGLGQWQKFVANNDQIFLVLNGHHSGDETEMTGDDGEAVLVSQNVYGKDVVQLCQDYQALDNGGNGYMRLIELDLVNGKINVKTYSPTLNAYMTDESSEFSIDLDFAARFESVMSRESTTIPTVQAANITVEQYSPDNEPTDILAFIPYEQSTPLFFMNDPNATEGGSNRGDIAIKVGENPYDDAINGIYIATIAENERMNADHYEHSGYSHVSSPAIGYGSGNNWIATFTTSRMYMDSTVLYAGGHEENVNVSAAYFPFEQGWIGAHGSNWTNNLALSMVISGGQITLHDELKDIMYDSVIIPRFYAGSADFPEQDGIWKLTLDGINSIRDGVLLACGGKNEDNYSAAAPTSDGEGWSIFTKDNGANGLSTGEEDPFNIVYIPYETPGIAAGVVSGRGGIRNGTENFRVYHEANGTYRLTIEGHSPETGALLLTQGTGTYAADNTMTYEPDGEAWIIQTRDLPNGGLQSNKYKDVGFVFAFIPFADAPAAPGPNRIFNESEISAGDFVVTSNASTEVGEIHRIAGRNYLTADHSDRGDFGMARCGFQMPIEEGIMMVTAREAFRTDEGSTFMATFSADRTCMYGGAGLTLHKAQTDAAECNANFAAVWLPFNGGYAGGHINIDDAVEASDGPAVTVTAGSLAGDHEIKLAGVTPEQGALFVTIQCNDDKTACISRNADNTGWRLVTRDNAQVFGFEDDEFGYLYLPYGSKEFIVAQVNAAGTTEKANGEFTVSKTSTGSYRVTIPGATPATGMLLLNSCDTNSFDEPKHVRMSYEADGDSFVVSAYELGADVQNLSDTAFELAFIPFDRTWTFENTFAAALTFADFGSFAASWNSVAGDDKFNADWDLNGDNAINTFDLIEFASSWLK